MGFCIRVVKIFILRHLFLETHLHSNPYYYVIPHLSMKTTLVTLLENKYSSSDLSSFISYIIFKQMHDKLIYHLRLYSAAQF